MHVFFSLSHQISNDAEIDCTIDVNGSNVTLSFPDRLFYIYTSGTTGLPKAAIVVHSRYVLFNQPLTRNLSSQELLHFMCS